MVFRRTNCKSLVSTSRARFSTEYKFSKKANFAIGSDAYIIPLGLEAGYCESACHRVLPHKVNGKLVGFNNSEYATYIKCKGVDEDNNKIPSLCCTLAQLEKDRLPDKNDSGKRLISFTTYRIHIPVLILGNSLNDPSKVNYPVSKVSLLNDLRSENGLKFAYLEMASSSFKTEILQAYGKKLKEEGVLDYEMKEDSEEFYTEMLSRLSQTVIKIHGVSKQGFTAPMKEYSFFPFSNPAIASGSPAGEREAIIDYKSNDEIQTKVCEFLDLFNIEVEKMFTDWTDKDLQEYYNSALGLDKSTSVEDIQNQMSETAPAEAQEDLKSPESMVETLVEKVEPITSTAVEAPAPAKELVAAAVSTAEPAPISDAEFENILKNPYGSAPAVEPKLEEFEFDMDEEEAFFEEE